MLIIVLFWSQFQKVLTVNMTIHQCNLHRCKAFEKYKDSFIIKNVETADA